MSRAISWPDAVIFDMDGLMLDTEPLYRRSWQDAAQAMEREISDELYATFIGRGTDDCMRMLGAHFGPEFMLSEFLQRSRAAWRECVTQRGIPHKPGLLELLEFFDAHALPRAVATSTKRENALFCLGELAARFHAIATGDEVQNGKPAPDIFLLAASRLGVAPATCLVLEDSDAGARAARAAGMNVVVVPDLLPPSPHATHVCASLLEVRNLLSATRSH
jgi:HAD superfamily hydrolase (TIGR01509 family)